MNISISPATAATTSTAFTVYGLTKISCDETIASGETVFLLEEKPNSAYAKAKDTDGSVISLVIGRTSYSFMACGSYKLEKTVTGASVGAGYDNEG